MAHRKLSILLLRALVGTGCFVVFAAAAPPAAADTKVGYPISATDSSSEFGPPLPLPLTVLRSFDPPAQPWLAGNRGVDLAARAGEPVLAAADGVVIFAGELAGRGVISISHGGVRTTYEPVDPVVRAGDQVSRGQLVGHVSSVADGCGPPGRCLHWGELRGRSYLDPMLLLAPPRIRLLPIWGG